jgi:CheY-like chemotaxis protein
MIRVLLVEDNPAWVKIVQENLEGGDPHEFSMEAAHRLGVALELLDGAPFDLVLTDLTLPDSAGLGTFHSIHSRAPDIPVVILSGVEDEQMALEAVRAGAQDYIVKGTIEPEYLARTLQYAIVRHAMLASASTGSRQRLEVTQEDTPNARPLILQIADRAEDRTLVEDLLKKEDVELLQVVDGEEGIFNAQTAHPTLILLDLQLRDMHALEFLRRLKEEPATRSIPVIVTLDSFSPRILQELEDAGAIGHLSKPITGMNLLTEIDRFTRPPSR